jgi:hypothetical protein
MDDFPQILTKSEPSVESIYQDLIQKWETPEATLLLDAMAKRTLKLVLSAALDDRVDLAT